MSYNPVTQLVEASRALMHGGDSLDAVLRARAARGHACAEPGGSGRHAGDRSGGHEAVQSRVRRGGL